MNNNNDCNKDGVLREGESCRFNNNCIYPNCSHPLPIIKYNNGSGALLCNECGVIIKDNLSKKDIERPYLLFCEEHYEKYINNTEEPGWVCFDCAKNRRASIPENHIYTTHFDICDICNKNKEVTEPRDFGLTRGLLRIYKKK